MVNFTKEKRYGASINSEDPPTRIELVALPSGGIAEDDLYETWYVYACPKCGRQVKESYRCETLVY